MDSGTLAPTRSPRENAAALLRRRIMPIPLPYGEKNPNRPGWERERYTVNDLDVFDGKSNLGMLLGHIVSDDGEVLTDKFIDVDLDTIEAIRAAPFYLPPTGMVWGRRSKPRSHYGYRLARIDGVKHVEYRDPTPRKILEGLGLKAMLCELRWTGKQTIAPGSVNKHGDDGPELVWWSEGGDGDPGDTTYEELVAAGNYISAAALLARYWTDGIRHLATLPLAGMLARGGMELQDAERFVRAVCTAACEPVDVIENDRIRCVRDTYARFSGGGVVTAIPTLEEFFDPKLVATLRKWLDLSRTSYGGDVGPDGWPLSDIGNAERFAEMYRGTMLYCDDESCWYIYDGARWKRDRSNLHRLKAMETVSAFRQKVMAAVNLASQTASSAGTATPEQMVKHLQKMGEMRNIRSMLDGAQSLLPVLPEEFNTDPFLLNVKNGTLELDVHTGEVRLREHTATDYITMMWNAPYVENATHHLIDQWLDMFFPETDRRRFLEEALGYSLTGLGKRWVFELFGPTRSGKSMTLHMLVRNAGDYAATLNYVALMPDPKGGGDKPRSDLIGLAGKRIVTVTEVPPGAHFDTALFKAMSSGGDSMTVRAIHAKVGRTIEFTFALWTSGNEVYGPSSKDDAAYGRIAVMRCEHSQPESNIDADLLQGETENPEVTGAAFLALAIRGFRRVYGHSEGEYCGAMRPPEVVKKATQELRERLDPWSDVIDEILDISPGDKCGIAKMSLWNYAREAYVSVVGEKSNFTAKDKLAFESALERRGLTLTQRHDRLNNRTHWKGAAFTPEAENLCTIQDSDWFDDRPKPSEKPSDG